MDRNSLVSKDEIEQIKKELSNHGYEYLKNIGFGHYSQVFLCKSTKYNILFAVKRVINDKVTNLEYNALISLNHPNIVQLYEIINEVESKYLVMDYCSNDTLMKKGKLNYIQFIHYAKQILEALSFCHSKLIAHRDIKPDNIFIDKYDRIKLADFGFAKHFEQGTASNERCGSIMYCAPEIVKDQSSFNPFQADVYALGITFYYMATGKLPFNNISSENIKRSIIFGQIDLSQFEIKPEIKNLIMKMTSRNPKLRPTFESLLKLPLFNGQQKTVSIYIPFSKSQHKFFTTPHGISKSRSFSADFHHPDENVQKQNVHPIINQCKSLIISPKVQVNSLNHTINH